MDSCEFVEVQHELGPLIQGALQKKLSQPHIPPATEKGPFLRLFLKAEDSALNDAVGWGH